MFARVTTDADGCVHAGSTVEIDGDTIDLPAMAPDGSRYFGDRIRAAVDMLGWEVVEPLLDHLTPGDGYIDVLVDFPGAGA